MLSATTVNGVATFTGCTIDKVGTGYTLTATDAADNLTRPRCQQRLQHRRRTPEPAHVRDTAGRDYDW